MAINDSGKRDNFSKILNLHLAIVEVGIAETNEEAWLRHLTTHPQDHCVDIRIFNRQKPDPESRGFEIKASEKIAKSY